MKKTAFPLFSLALAAALLLVPAVATFAQKKKEPLTVKKVGKDIGHVTTRLGRNVAHSTHRAAKNTEYAARKVGENTSDTAHRAVGRNSLERNRGKKETDVVKPDGTHIVKKKG